MTDILQFPASWSNLRVDLSHDWLTGMRGGEKVLELLGRGFPGAPIYTLVHVPSAISEPLRAHPVHASWLNHVPGIRNTYRYFLPLFPSAVRSFRPEPADLIISTNHCVAKALPVPDGAAHLCYCFTPMRYAWTFYEEYFGRNPLKKAVLKPTLAALRQWDRKTSRQVTRFVAISEHIRRRIQRFYDRDADVVYPPVDTNFYTPGPTPHEAGTFDLVVSALVPYKRVDLAVRTYTQLGFPLKVIGIGTEAEHLQSIAGPNVTFLGWQSDESIRDHYRACRALVFPGEEDFGIVPVEVQACGRPVLAFRKGGALETVKEGETGLFFDQQSVESLLAGVEEVATTTWDPAPIRSQAERFSRQSFLDELNQSIRLCLE